MVVTVEDVKKLAKLSKISMNEEELNQLTEDMQKIISFAHEINDACDGEFEFTDINNIINVFRDDIVEESFDRKEILSGVNGGEDGFFAVKKLI